MQGIFLENNTLGIRNDIPVPEPDFGEALIRVRTAGICSTDLELVRGYYPYRGVLGHEFVGEVVHSPDDSSWEGIRVVGEINAVCGKCENCLAGRKTHCDNRTVLGIKDRSGAFAEFLTLPLDNLLRVPDNMPDERAVFVEPLAAALEILEQVPIKSGDRVIVVGAGRLGQLVAQTIALTGCTLSVVARHESQRRLLETRGIPVMDETNLPHRNFDIAVDTTGSPGGFAVARNALRPRGTLVIKSTYAGALQVDFSSIVVDEITVIGSRCGPFLPALDLLAGEKVDTSSLISGRYPITNGLLAFEHAARSGVFKILLSQN
ncbi:MAG: alcohol dehydrogenase catalytic domain-containing protein [Chloroflexota bacterium]